MTIVQALTLMFAFGMFILALISLVVVIINAIINAINNANRK